MEANTALVISTLLILEILLDTNVTFSVILNQTVKELKSISAQCCSNQYRCIFCYIYCEVWWNFFPCHTVVTCSA
jgi:hypothetical protein